MSLNPGSGRSPGEWKINPLQYSYLENPVDRGAQLGITHGGLERVQHDLVAKKQTTTSIDSNYFFKIFLKCIPFKKSLLNLLQCCFCFMFWFLGQKACGILAAWPWMEPTTPALEGKVLSTGPRGKSQECSCISDNLCFMIFNFCEQIDLYGFILRRKNL